MRKIDQFAYMNFLDGKDWENKRGMENIESRIEWIDIAKGLGILFVMLGHCYLDTKYTFWFISFHMPLFFFLSGYTFRIKGKYFSFLNKKIKSLLVPYLFFVIVTMLCNGLLAVTHGNHYDVIGIIKLYLIQNRYTLLWFLTCLFLTEQFMFLLERLYLRLGSKKEYWIIVSSAEFILFYFYQIKIGIDLPWNADLVLIGLAFMNFGKYIHEIELMKKIQKKNLLLGSMLLLLCVCFSGYNYFYFGKVDWYSNQYGNVWLYLVSAFSGVFATIFLLSRIKCKSLAILGRNSLIFYGLHRLIIDNLVYVVYPKLRLQVNGETIISLILAIVNVLIAIIVLGIFNYFVMKYIPCCIGKKRRRK